jgi:hypothetical protein
MDSYFYCIENIDIGLYSNNIINKIFYKYILFIIYKMMSLSPTNVLNPANVHGGPFTADATGAVANAGNTQYGALGGSPAALRGGGLYSVTGENGSPSAIQKPMGASSCSAMSGGGKRRKHSRKHKRSHSRSKSSKKYARKRSLKYRIKHRRSRSHPKKYGTRKSQAGGYHQYMGNTPFTLGYRTPGFNLPSNMSSLANPSPFMPYNNCGK